MEDEFLFEIRHEGQKLRDNLSERQIKNKVHNILEQIFLDVLLEMH
jgi:hypothetical protein